MVLGRPSKLTPEVQQKVCEAIRAGNYRETAARYAGISPAVLRLWMKRGQAEDTGVHHDFFKAILDAEQAAEMYCVAIVMKAAKEDPKHAQWWLERKCHKRWGRKDKTILTGKTSEPVTVQIVEQVVTPQDGSAS